MQKKLKPLEISCTSSDCEKDLHCFRATAKMIKLDLQGSCRACGARLFDRERIHRRKLDDVNYTFNSLKYEMIRHYFWHAEIDEEAISKARKKGIDKLREETVKRIRSSVGKAKPFRDGYQTPFAGNIIYYGQHATASCCRKCIEDWHGIPQRRELIEDEIEYLASLVCLYIDERLKEFAHN